MFPSVGSLCISVSRQQTPGLSTWDQWKPGRLWCKEDFSSHGEWRISSCPQAVGRNRNLREEWSLQGTAAGAPWKSWEYSVPLSRVFGILAGPNGCLWVEGLSAIANYTAHALAFSEELSLYPVFPCICLWGKLVPPMRVQGVGAPLLACQHLTRAVT